MKIFMHEWILSLSQQILFFNFIQKQIWTGGSKLIYKLWCKENIICYEIV